MRFAAAILTFLLAATLLPASRAAAAATSLPGGKSTFVVSQGHLRASSQQNWVRLGNYSFAKNGTVSAGFYLWWQRQPKARQSTGTKPDASCTTTAGGTSTKVRACQVLTAGGFTGGPSERRTGTYTVSGNVLTITWKIAQTWTEQWYVRTSPDGKLARLDLKRSTLATHGYGYGSNASYATRRAMSSVDRRPLRRAGEGRCRGQADRVRTPRGGAGGGANAPGGPPRHDRAARAAA